MTNPAEKRLRTYWVDTDEGDGLGLAIVAYSMRDARVFASHCTEVMENFESYMQMCYSLRTASRNSASIEGMTPGVVTDSWDGLRRGLYARLDESLDAEHPCEQCGITDGDAFYERGEILCSEHA